MAFIDFEKAYDFVPREALFFKMLHAGMNGPVLRVLYSMYQAVYSVVKIGLDQSEVINQMIGLRQGCILSPCLFSFYIADFPAFIASRTGDEKCEGVLLFDTIVHILMYADDMALVATSEADLQRMLDALYEYCKLWRMFVNVKKTKVVIFHKSVASARTKAEKANLASLHEMLHNECAFTYNGKPIDIVHEFKYLGLMFNEHVEHLRKPTHTNNPWPCDIKVARKYDSFINHRLKQARAALAIWMRRIRVWMFPVDVSVNMYRTCVMPALEYGAGVWGPGVLYGDSIDKIENLWISNARFILNIPLRTPTAGVQGELGWFPFAIRAKTCSVSLLIRATCAKHDSMLYKAMCMQRRLTQTGHACWLSNVSVFMRSSGDVVSDLILGSVVGGKDV